MLGRQFNCRPNGYIVHYPRLEARAKGIDIAPKYIPAEVFDKRAVEKNQVVFHDVAAIEVKVHFSPLTPSPSPKGSLTPGPSPRGRGEKTQGVAVELTDFSVFYPNDDSLQAPVRK